MVSEILWPKFNIAASVHVEGHFFVKSPILHTNELLDLQIRIILSILLWDHKE